jgi:hypothetical protein
VRQAVTEPNVAGGNNSAAPAYGKGNAARNRHSNARKRAANAAYGASHGSGHNAHQPRPTTTREDTFHAVLRQASAQIPRHMRPTIRDIQSETIDAVAVAIVARRRCSEEPPPTRRLKLTLERW